MDQNCFALFVAGFSVGCLISWALFELLYRGTRRKAKALAKEGE